MPALLTSISSLLTRRGIKQSNAMARLVFLLFLTTTIFLAPTAQARSRNKEDPEKQLERCMDGCEPRHSPSCVQDCLQKYERAKGRQGSGGGLKRKNIAEEESRGRESENPYFFDEDSFTDRYRTEEGSFQVLERFATNTNVLLGIDSYRIGIFQANPLAYALPHHCDSDATFYVSRGRGTIVLLGENNRDAYNVEEGDILLVKAGTIILIANTDENRQLQIVTLMDPAATPGEVEQYFVAGGEDPESILGGFSKELGQAAFKVSEDQLKKLTGRHNKGPILKGSKEQMKALRRHASSSKGPRPWPFTESKGPFNLLDQRPSISNQYGQLFEADERHYEGLGNSDLSFAFINITKRAMELPNYNTKSPRVVVVLRGKGLFEMVCPHLPREREREEGGTQEGEGEEGKGREEEGGRGQEGEGEKKERGEARIQYETVRSEVSPNTAFVAPPGHAVITAASEEEDLELLWIQLYYRENRRHYLAGRNNLLKQYEKDEMDISFGKEGRKMLQAQNDEGFTKGPEQSGREEGRHRAVESIIGFAGF